MTEPNYEVDRDPDALRIKLEGELDMRLAPRLRELLRREFSSPPPQVLIDLQRVPFIDSSIIATFVDALKHVRKQGAELRIENCQPAVRDTFEVTRLLESFGIA